MQGGGWEKNPKPTGDRYTTGSLEPKCQSVPIISGEVIDAIRPLPNTTMTILLAIILMITMTRATIKKTLPKKNCQ